MFTTSDSKHIFYLMIIWLNTNKINFCNKKLGFLLNTEQMINIHIKLTSKTVVYASVSDITQSMFEPFWVERQHFFLVS